MQIVPMNPYLAVAFVVAGVAAMWFAFSRYRALSENFPGTDYPKFALPFGVGWILFFTGTASLWFK
jgi:hypothetical protein